MGQAGEPDAALSAHAHRMPVLGAGREFDLIRRFVQSTPLAASNAVLLGPGDDCALLQQVKPGHVLAVSTDMLIEGRHFFPGTHPKSVGHKALAVNLSDLAAMGASPVACTMAVSLVGDDIDWLAGVLHGFTGLGARLGCPLVGGDMTRSAQRVLSVTVMGEVPPALALRRDGARDGDDLWVTGPLGAAALAVWRRSRDARSMPAAESPSPPEPRFHYPPADPDTADLALDMPEPRLADGLNLRGLARAAMDVSDGLAGDLGHLLAASSAAGGVALGAMLDAQTLPCAPILSSLDSGLRQALCLHGGDDYELLFSASSHCRARIQHVLPNALRFGAIRAGTGIWLVQADGSSSEVVSEAFDHFVR